LVSITEGCTVPKCDMYPHMQAFKFLYIYKTLIDFLNMRVKILLTLGILAIVFTAGCTSETGNVVNREGLSIIETLTVNPCIGMPINVWSKPDSALRGAVKIGEIPDCQNIEVEVLDRKCSSIDIEFDLIRYKNTEGWVTRRLLLCPPDIQGSGCFFAPDTICETEKYGECPSDMPFMVDEDHGVCAECIDNDDCPWYKPVCLTNTCVECITDSDCDSEWHDEICLNNVCVECENDKDCPSTEPACDLQTNECVECIDNSYCDRSEPVCVKITGDVINEGYDCVACETNSDCPSHMPVCRIYVADIRKEMRSPYSSNKIQVHECVECIEDGDCPSNYPVCDFYDCVECKTDKHCKDPAKPACDSIFNRCVECTRDSYCTDENKPYCSPNNKCTDDYV